MKIKLLLSSLFAFIFSICLLQAQNYQAAESAEYDPVNKRWLSSNGANIIADDGHGNLSYFGSGSASYGMEVMDDKLFAIDGNVLRVFDLNTELELGSVTITGASFLNGITNDGVSAIYLTDFSGKRIYKVETADLQNMTFEVIVPNTVSTPNGILYDGDNNRLIFVNWGNSAPIKAVDLTDNSVSTIIPTSLGNIDGIDDDNDGNYYISSWSPTRITKYDNNFANPETISTPFISNPADIGYSKSSDSLAIPIGNNVVFVAFEQDSTSSVTLLDNEKLAFTVFPNPVTDQSYVQFDLENAQELNLKVFDNQGRFVTTVLSGVQPSGKHKVLLTGMNLSAGIYHLRLQTKEGIITRKMFVH